MPPKAYIPPGSLQTLGDKQTPDLSEGLEVYAARVEAKKKLFRGRNAQVLEQGKQSAGSVPYKRFLIRHPEYHADWWAEFRALYAGGPRLLRNKELMKKLFPAHRNEDPEVYKERSARAHYFPYAGSIIDHLVAGLGADPLRVDPANSEDNPDAALSDWWKEFLDDVSPPGGKRQSLQELLVEVIRESLITQCAWVLVDLPPKPDDPDAQPTSQLDQEKRGLLNPYAIGVESEFVVDWQDDANGELEWAMICDVEERRDSINSERDTIVKTWTVYDRVGWFRYRLAYKKDDPPQEETPVELVDFDAHTFGKVPLVRVKLPEGLWAMGKLESLAREHFNKRNAVAWAEYKSLFAILYEFLAPEDGTSMRPVSEAQSDPDRGVGQPRGQGFSQLRGNEDRAEFVGPDVGPFKEARESCDQLMREMHRVMFSLALSVDSTGAAIRRSGESKAQDKAISAVILRALGKFMRDAVRDLLELVGAVQPLDPTVSGASKFDSIDITQAISEAVELMNGVPMKSPLFKQRFLLRLYKLVLADELSEEDLSTMREEIEAAINAETQMLEDSMDLERKAALLDDDEGEFESDRDDRVAARREERERVVASGGGSSFDSAAGRRRR